MALWDDVLSERDKHVFAAAGYGKRQGFGRRPAVIVVDVNYNMQAKYADVGSLEAVRRYLDELPAALYAPRQSSAAVRA